MIWKLVLHDFKLNHITLYSNFISTVRNHNWEYQFANHIQKVLLTLKKSLNLWFLPYFALKWSFKVKKWLKYTILEVKIYFMTPIRGEECVLHLKKLQKHVQRHQISLCWRYYDAWKRLTVHTKNQFSAARFGGG